MNIKNFHGLLEWFRDLPKLQKEVTIELMTRIMEREE